MTTHTTGPTTGHDPDRDHEPDHEPDPDTAAVLARAAGLGVALGVVDLVLIRLLPHPLADLANSSALWAVAAFALGRTLRVAPASAAAAGAVLLVVAVESYYLLAVLVDLASPVRLVTAHTVTWCVLGVLAGAAFGAAGTWSRDTHRWRAAGAVALAVGVVLAEAWVRRALPDTALLTVLFALGLLGVVPRDQPERTRAALLALPLAVACVVGFSVAGF